MHMPALTAMPASGRERARAVFTIACPWMTFAELSGTCARVCGVWRAEAGEEQTTRSSVWYQLRTPPRVEKDSDGCSWLAGWKQFNSGRGVEPAGPRPPAPGSVVVMRGNPDLGLSHTEYLRLGTDSLSAAAVRITAEVLPTSGCTDIVVQQLVDLGLGPCGCGVRVDEDGQISLVYVGNDLDPHTFWTADHRLEGSAWARVDVLLSRSGAHVSVCPARGERLPSWEEERPWRAQPKTEADALHWTVLRSEGFYNLSGPLALVVHAADEAHVRCLDAFAGWDGEMPALEEAPIHAGSAAAAAKGPKQEKRKGGGGGGAKRRGGRK
eukprot:TRINITY_DN4489_c1_g1_i1.p1 TRINITY_DN4489_c1_g1~~TRINITY_DN4489_c1_g1_i1.p1  ORF type:complete len:356 (+),score=93.80 TRINITY_DN4489_c1_g1_i1:95-1069(+)